MKPHKEEPSLPWFDMQVKLPKGILLKNCPVHVRTIHRKARTIEILLGEVVDLVEFFKTLL